jgi:hypothetical protein
MTHGNATHRDTGSKEYQAWICMKRKNKNICKRWLHSYENFLADVGRKPEPPPGQRLLLSRLDLSKPYEPGNVDWITQGQQNRIRNQHLTFQNS